LINLRFQPGFDLNGLLTQLEFNPKPTKVFLDAVTGFAVVKDRGLYTGTYAARRDSVVAMNAPVEPVPVPVPPIHFVAIPNWNGSVCYFVAILLCIVGNESLLAEIASVRNPKPGFTRSMQRLIGAMVETAKNWATCPATRVPVLVNPGFFMDTWIPNPEMGDDGLFHTQLDPMEHFVDVVNRLRDEGVPISYVEGKVSCTTVCNTCSWESEPREESSGYSVNVHADTSLQDVRTLRAADHDVSPPKSLCVSCAFPRLLWLLREEVCRTVIVLGVALAVQVKVKEPPVLHLPLRDRRTSSLSL
jgi:hypothetical protein